MDKMLFESEPVRDLARRVVVGAFSLLMGRGVRVARAEALLRNMISLFGFRFNDRRRLTTSARLYGRY